MRFYSIVLVFLILQGHAQVIRPAHDPKFYKVLHLEKNSKSYAVDFLENDFFFSKFPIDLEKEYIASLEAFKNPNWKHPRLNLPATCLFPARKKVIERLSGQIFPKVSCPDLDFWKTKLNSTHVSLLFAGAYAQNPASVFGHSLIRLSDRSNPQRTSPLLSYVVGFLANTGDDGSLLRIRKGLLGEYPGYYLLDPFYIKLGVYNNAESRDIWESDLNFTKEEIEFLIEHLWEITHFSKSYYFIGRNCSYQVLKLFEAVRPSLNLIERKKIETLPHESIRWVQEAGLISAPPRFYPSLRRKIIENFRSFNPDQQKRIIKAMQDNKSLKDINDPNELDLINAYWLLKNYQKKTKLDDIERDLMEKSLIKRATFELPSASHQDLIYRENGPLPPYLGHKTRSLRIGMNSQDYAEFSFFFGAHGFDQDDRGYDSFSSIQYLGIESYQPLYSKYAETNFVITRIRSSENYSKFDPKKSWLVNIEIRDASPLLKEKRSRLFMDGGWGLSGEFNQLQSYILALLNAETDINNKYTSILRPGALVGLKWSHLAYRVVIESLAIEYLNQWQTFESFTFGYSLNSDHSFYLKKDNRNYLRENRLSINYEITF